MEKTKNTSVVCQNCGGQIDVNALDETVECPFCGASYSVSNLLNESDAVRIEKIRTNAQQKIEQEKLNHEKEKNKSQEEKDEIEKFKKSKFSKVLIVFSIIGVLFIGTAFNSGKIFAGLVGIIMTAGFIATYLMKSHIIKEPKRGISSIIVVVAFLLIVPYFSLYNGGGSSYKTKAEKFEWNDIEMHEILPEPEKTYGEIGHNSKTSLILTLCKITEKDFKTYKELCIGAGFTIEADETYLSYSAYNKDGYSVRLVFSSSNEEMNVYLDAPEEMSEFEWPTSGLGTMLPITKSNIGRICWNNSETFIVHVGNTSIQEYNEYVKACEQKGFTVDYSKGDKTYSALNTDGYKISLMYLGFNNIEISLKVTKNSTTETKPATPTETETKPTTPTETETKPTETTKPTENKTSNNTGLGKEFKEAMDSYEAFVDEYIAFMKKYLNSNGTDMTLITDYAKYVSKLADAEEKFNKWEDEDMNSAETAYYIEVQTRVNKKLLEVAN